MWKYVSFAIAALAILAMVQLRVQRQHAREAGPSKATVAAPAWELRDVDGQPVSSRQFLGQVVLLDFWATWCPPCRAEIPGFVELQSKYADKGLVVVGVSLDRTGPASVKEFMQRFSMNYPVVMGDEAITQAFGGIKGIPTTFIINRKGHIVTRHVGYADKETFENEIKPLL